MNDSYMSSVTEQKDKEIAQLKACYLELTGEYHTDCNILINENNQLKARVRELEVALSQLNEPHANYLVRQDCTVTELLNRTPAQSLAAHDAEIQAQALEEEAVRWVGGEQYPKEIRRSMQARAAELRQQAKGE